MNKSLIALLCLSLGGCIEIPVLRQSKPELPQTWPTVIRATRDSAVLKLDPALRLQTWWQAFDDPAMNKLVDEAIGHNADLQLAAARIEEAAAALGMADADHALQAGVTLGASRKRITEKGATATTSPVSSDFIVNAQASYEIDLWGRLRDASAAARADLLASRYAREVVRVSLIDAVAEGYFQLCALDAEMALADKTLDNRREAVDLNRIRFEGGIASELPLRQAEAELAALESARADLERQRRQQETALAILLGRSPRDLLEAPMARGKTLDDLTIPPGIPAGLPSELLARRPDIRQAEQQMIGTEYRLKADKAAIYPSLSLTANLGRESRALSDLFSGPAAIWGMGASLAQTLLNGHRTDAVLKTDAMRHEQALIGYEQTLRRAFKDVLDALVAARQARVSEAAENRRSEALARAAELAGLRYQNGVSSYLEVLDAQRNLHQAQQNRIEARRAQLSATASLMKALGGGWSGVVAAD